MYAHLVGGAPGSVALFALCVPIWCAVASGCQSSAEGSAAAPVHAAPRGVEARDASDAGGALTVAPSGAGASARAPSGTPLPNAVAGEGGATSASEGGASGGTSVGRDESSAGEPSAAGAPTVIAAPRPSCGKQQDGTLCGGNMTPAGVDGMRYFCARGEVLAEARCPAACNVETNACEQSGGTGTGSGETGLYAALRCPECYATICRAELVACQSSPRCVAHLACVESCSLERECYSICDRVFADEPLFGDLDQCAEQTGCAASCQSEGP